LVEPAGGVAVVGATVGSATTTVVDAADGSTTTVESATATVVTADPSFGASVVGGAIGLPNSST